MKRARKAPAFNIFSMEMMYAAFVRFLLRAVLLILDSAFRPVRHWQLHVYVRVQRSHGYVRRIKFVTCAHHEQCCHFVNFV